MKIIYKLKYTLLLLFGMFQIVSVKAAFNEDFSSSSLKLPAMFVSKVSFDYKYFNTNNRLNALNNVVVSPTKKIDDSDSWWKWKLNVNQDYSVLLNTSIEGVVKANDDHFTFEYSTFNIASNDTFDGKTEALILTGAHQNATISPLGVWPLGIKLDATTGEIKIAPGTSLPKEPLMYNLCVFNSSTCSTANITFDNQSVSIDKNEMFSLSSEISTICYSGNAQSRVVRYTLKNISGRAIKISGESKGSGVNNKKIRFVGGNINVNSLRVISGDMRFTGALGYVGPKIFAIDEEVVFELSFKRSTDAEISGKLEMRYGNSSASGQMDNPDFRLNVSNKISRIPDKQKNFTIKLNETGSYRVHKASGLEDAIVNYKFYDSSGNEVAGDSPIDMNFTGILNYSYSKVSASGCEGERGYISFSKTDIELPDPGKISLSEGEDEDSLLEYTFVPTNARGKAVAYKGVRVIVGSLLAVANNAVLYGAYYEKDRVLAENETVPEETIYAKGAKLPASNTQPNKLKYIVPNSPEDIVVLTPQNETTGIKLNNYVNDVTWGVEDAGLGVATSLSSVVYPYLAVDEDPFTYAIFNKTVAALNRQKLTVNLRNTARPGDELELIMTSEGVNILSLDLGASFKVQRYMDDIPVGPVVASNQFKVINLNLFLFKNPIPRFRITGIDQPFNRVEITYFSLVQANLGNYTYLHDISIVPQSVFGNTIDVNKTLEICAADLIKIKKPSVCTDFKLNFVLGEIVEQEVFDYDENGQLVSKIVKSYKELEGESNQLKDNVVTRVHEDANTAYYEIKKLYEINNPNQILLVKVQAVQNGQDYGAPQYIRVELKNCLDSMVNPVINLDTKDLINIKDFSASN
ncbi:hypothetical protein OBK30_07150 [Empedobacter falsenii]